MDSADHFTYRQASNTDYEIVSRLLREHQLPADDCLAHLAHFFILEIENCIIGIGGLEVHGQLGLVRSIVILEGFRSKGMGKYLLHLITRHAYKQGVQTVFLLTEDAQEYFSRSGFVVADRATAPEAIKQTRQFKSLCPASAVLMSMDIEKA